MGLHKVTDDTFEEFISNDDNQVTVLDFWAQWCGPCVQFEEVLKKVSTEPKYENVKFGKINVEEEKELAGEFGLRSIPHIMIFRGNIAVYSESGACSAEALKELIDKASSLDINEIKSNLETE